MQSWDGSSGTLVNNSTFIRLAGPLQSWAGPRVTGYVVETEVLPTRSGLLGLIAASLGSLRGQWPAWLGNIDFLVRRDRQGGLVTDYQTISPRARTSDLRANELLFRERLFYLQGGEKISKGYLAYTPAGEDKTAPIRRTYLAGAEFLVRVTCPNHQEEVDAALRSPAFVTYLGKKAFAPSFPFYLGRGEADTFNRIPVFDPAFKKPKKQVWTYSRAPYTADSGPGALPGTSSMVDVVSDRGEWMNRVAALLDR